MMTRMTMGRMKKLLLGLLLVSSVGSHIGSARADGVAVVVHPSNKLAALEAADVMRVFLGKSKTFPNDTAAEPVGLKDGQAARKSFDSLVLNKTTNQVRAFWAQQIFTGRGTPPREFESSAELKSYVASHPQAVGYLDPAEADKTVRVILTLP